MSSSSKNRKLKSVRTNSEGEPSTGNFDTKLLEAIKHYDTFYESAPPGFVKESEERPEDCIPDLPENAAARDFLAKAPTKGLWMPLGKEVKVMKCWRCKTYGHRTGDKECPLFLSGNKESEQFRYIHEDPMYDYIQQNQIKDRQLTKVEQLKALLDDSSNSNSSSSSSSSSSSQSSSSSSESSSSSSDEKRKKSHKRKRHQKRGKKQKQRKK